MDEEITILELNGLYGEEMTELIKYLQLVNVVRLKNEIKREVIATR